MPAKNIKIRDRIIDRLRKEPTIALSRGELAKMLGVEPHTLPLTQMKAEGTLLQQGLRGKARYLLTSKMLHPEASKAS